MSIIKKANKLANKKSLKEDAQHEKDLAIAYSVQRRARGKSLAMAKDDITPGPQSVVEAVRQRQKKVADGDVDLNRNADEDLNYEDQLSYMAGRQQSYSEEEGLDLLDQPEDSNQHDVELEDADSHDMVGKIRSKIRSKRA